MNAPASPDLLRALFDESSDGLLIADASGRYVAVNARGCELTGFAAGELAGMTRADLLSPGVPGLLVRKDRTSIAVEVTERSLQGGGRLEIMRDVSDRLAARKTAEAERQRLERQLAQARKLESVGRLAGGVAHDFNNMLSVIIGRSELALSRMDPSHPVCADIAALQHAAERSAALTRQLLSFARKQPAERTMLDLNDVVDGNLSMLRRIVGGHIEMAWLPAGGLWPIEAEPTQIGQVLANLVGNARDAMSVGRISIATSNVFVEQAEGTAPQEIVPGPYVVLQVADSGHGMDGETQARLFDPFYTTKAEGRGTGLGLATVHNIVTEAGGGIVVSTAVGQGTTFRIFLPAFPTGVARTAPARRSA